jgi:hypothetical protein
MGKIRKITKYVMIVGLVDEGAWLFGLELVAMVAEKICSTVLFL